MKPQKPLDLVKVARRERIAFEVVGTVAGAALLLAAAASIVLTVIGVNP